MLRAISATTKLAATELGMKGQSADRLSSQIVSAVGEAFNNIALHGYSGVAPGVVRLELEVVPDGLVVRLEDFGRSFDPADVPLPDLDALPESGLGVFIIRSFVDEVTYTPGHPNQMTLFKKVTGRAPAPLPPQP